MNKSSSSNNNNLLKNKIIKKDIIRRNLSIKQDQKTKRSIKRIYLFLRPKQTILNPNKSIKILHNSSTFK